MVVSDETKMFVLISSLLIFLSFESCIADQECQPRKYGQEGIVCVCSSNHCDTITSPDKVEAPEYIKYTSNRAGLRFLRETGSFHSVETGTNEVRVSTEEKFQTVLGWGGAFTDSAGINIDSLGEEVQELLLKSYFSDEGIEYDLCRVPIGGTDFSQTAYSYDDGDVDVDLLNFQLAPEDFKYKIPYIKKAQNLTKGKLRLFASAWTAPKWMKTNGNYSGFGFLLKNMYQTWADYFVKFLDGYLEEGIEFWGITTGNEPSIALLPIVQISSVGWTPMDMGGWILNNLGPAVRNSVHSNIKIMVLDDQRLFLPWIVNIALQNTTTREYVDGIAVHWYTDSVVPASVLTETHRLFPEKFILATEASNVNLFHEDLGSWSRGEAYSFDIIEDLANWVGGWIDWNLALDVTGGPTYLTTPGDSPIIVNATANEFYKQPMYYHLGHFSKFVPRDSVRIGSSTNSTEISVVAFQKPDDGIVVVVLNKNEGEVPVTITDGVRGTGAEMILSPKSITTILYW